MTDQARERDYHRYTHAVLGHSVRFSPNRIFEWENDDANKDITSAIYSLTEANTFARIVLTKDVGSTAHANPVPRPCPSHVIIFDKILLYSY